MNSKEFDEFDKIMYKAIKEKLKRGETLTPQEQELYDYYTNTFFNQNQEEKSNTR